LFIVTAVKTSNLTLYIIDYAVQNIQVLSSGSGSVVGSLKILVHFYPFVARTTNGSLKFAKALFDDILTEDANRGSLGILRYSPTLTGHCARKLYGVFPTNEQQQQQRRNVSREFSAAGA
jgi:hypothetical protein